MAVNRRHVAAWLGFFVTSYDGMLSSVALAPALVYFLPEDAGPVLAGVLILTLFNISRLGRPVGGYLFGRWVDRGNDVAAATVSAVGYGLAAILTAMLPGHAQLGWLSVAGLLLLRVVSGMFLAGQGVAFTPGLIADAPRDRRWLVGALLPTGSPVSYVAGGLLTLAVFAIAPPGGAGSAYAEWGWRITYLVAAVLSAVCFVVVLPLRAQRHAILRTEPAAPRPPAPVVVDRQRRRDAFLRVLLLLSGIQIVLSTSVAALPGTLIQVLGYDATQVTNTVILTYLLMSLSYPLAGWLSTRVPVVRLSIGWATLTTLLGAAGLPLLSALPGHDQPLPGLLLMAVVTLVSLSVFGFMHTFTVVAFDRAVLGTSYGTARGFAELVPVPSGLYLLLLSYPFGAAAPAVLMSVGGIMAITGIRAVGRLSRSS